MGRRLRVLLLNWMDPWHPRAGGAEEHLRQLFGRIAARGHRVTLVSSGFRGGASRLEREGLRIRRVGGRLSFALRAPGAARRLIRDGGFDLVVEDLNKVPLFVPRWTTLPTVVLAHHLWGRVAFGAAGPGVAAATVLLEAAIGPAYRRARFVAVSPSTRHDLIRRGVAPDRVTVIPNAVDQVEGPPTQAGRFTRPTFVYLGRLQAYKRVGTLLTAARELSDEGHRFRMLIAGRGPEERRLRADAARLGLSDTVEFAGFLPEAEKAGFFALAWANVLMSRKEGWGLTVLEAAAVGTPSVVASAPGLMDAVAHLDTGLWVPHHHLPTLTDALRFLILNPGEVERMGSRARTRASGLSHDEAADRLESLLLEAAAPACRRGRPSAARPTPATVRPTEGFAPVAASAIPYVRDSRLEV